MTFQAIIRVMRDESGATAVEYGLIAAMVAAVAVPALSVAGWFLDKIFDAVPAVLSGTAG